MYFATGRTPANQTNLTAPVLGLAVFLFTTFAVLLPADAQIAGRTEYTGTESGKIFVEAFTESDATFEKLETDMINPGPFSFDNVAEGTYTVIAYIDTNDSGQLDSDETWVEYGQPVTVPPGDQDVVLNLDEPGVGGGGAGDEDGDNGCCAVVNSREQTPAALAVLFGIAVVLLRRRSQ